MVDPFKFTEYPLWVRVFIVLWGVQTLLLFILPLFVKPSQNELHAASVKNPPTLQPQSEMTTQIKIEKQQPFNQKGGNGIYVGKGAKVRIINATANHNGNNGVLVEHGGEATIENTETNYNRNNGISIESYK